MKVVTPPGGGGEFPARLRAARVKAGLSQSELAAKSGVALGTVCRLEQGRSKEPKLSSVRPLAAALGVAIEELMGGR